MQKNKIQVGIVGAGFIADLHMEGLSRIDNVNVVSCCDVNYERSKSFGNRWNISSCYADLDEMIEKEKIDVAHVLVPPNYHLPVAKKMIENGINLFLEKPMGETTQDCIDLVELAKLKKVQIGINHNFIFYPLFQRLKKDIANNKIGKPEYVSAFYGGPLGQLDFNQFGNWMFQKPENIILEQGPHPISQVMSLLGDIKHITAKTSSKKELGKNQFFYDRWQALAECEEGHAFLHLSFGKQYSNQRNIHVFGRDGSIFIDFLNNRYLVQKKSIFPDYLEPTANAMHHFSTAFGGIKDFSDYAMSKVKLKDRSDSFFMTMKNSIKAFYEAFTKSKTLPCSGEDGLKVIQACKKWIDSAQIEPNPETTYVFKTAQKDDEILVTGATGFIGNSLVEKLISKGKKVRILVRNIHGLNHNLYSDNVRILQGDITDPDCIDQAVKGVHTVYHLAHSIGKNWDEFERFNIEPARHFGTACLKEGATLIYASTIAVYYYQDIAPGKVKYNSPIDSEPDLRNGYARSKIVAEKMLLDMYKKDGLRVIITRPGIVVGQNGILEHSGVGLWTRDNVCAYWGSGKNELPFVLVEDTAQALVNMIGKQDLEGLSLNLVGDVRLSAREYIAALKQFSRRDITAFAYPSRLMYWSDAFKIMIKKIGGDKNTFLSYRDLSNRAVNAKFDTEFEKSSLAWNPCNDKEDFIQQAFSWAY